MRRITDWHVALRWVLPLVLATLSVSRAQGQATRQEIQFPNLPGYKTLKCDLHMHTVFSDGYVWPTVRVEEAWRQGLDVIAITDHIEYQPKKEDVPTDHNRGYELAAAAARSHGLLLLRGTEITRDTPPGHFNAVFLDDVDPLDTPDFVDAIKAAHEQQAFIFWNHQGWKGEDRGRWMDVHTTIYEGKMLHGMEVANGATYYPSAHRWCLEKGLTMMGNSDIHDPDLRTKSDPENHRTMTLVFAEKQTVPGVKEALQAGRTAVWYQDQLIGRAEYLEGIFEQAVTVKQPVERSGKTVWLQLHNACDLPMRLERSGEQGPQQITLPPRTTTLIRFDTSTPDAVTDLRYTATNLLVAPETGLAVSIRVPK